MVLSGEEGLLCNVHVDRISLEHVSEIKYLGCVLDESSTDGVECSKNVASGRRAVGTIRFLVNVRDLQLEYAKVFHETILIFFCIAVRQCYGRRKRDLGLFSWTI